MHRGVAPQSRTQFRARKHVQHRDTGNKGGKLPALRQRTIRGLDQGHSAPGRNLGTDFLCSGGDQSCTTGETEMIEAAAP